MSPEFVNDGRADSVAGHGPHVEAGAAKVDGSGNVRTNKSNTMPKIVNDKKKVDY